jgi:hypothetical protein
MRDENQLHAAVVELIALDDAEIKYSTVQNWYPGDKDGKGGIYNFVTKRGDCRGNNSKISWTQVETGSAITWKYPSCILRGDNSRRRVLFDRHFERLSAGRFGTKMIHLGKNTSSRIISKGIAAGRRTTPIAARSAHRKAEKRAQLHPVRQLLIGNQCGAHTVPYIEAKNSTASSSMRPRPRRSPRTSCSTACSPRPQRGRSGRADRQRLRQGRDPATADGVHGRNPEADRHRLKAASVMKDDARQDGGERDDAGTVRLGGAVAILLSCALGYWADPFGNPMLSAGVLGMVAGISFAVRPFFVGRPKS